MVRYGQLSLVELRRWPYWVLGNPPACRWRRIGGYAPHPDTCPSLLNCQIPSRRLTMAGFDWGLIRPPAMQSHTWAHTSDSTVDSPTRYCHVGLPNDGVPARLLDLVWLDRWYFWNQSLHLPLDPGGQAWGSRRRHDPAKIHALFAPPSTVNQGVRSPAYWPRDEFLSG